jgi:hypothetical protein
LLRPQFAEKSLHQQKVLIKTVPSKVEDQMSDQQGSSSSLTADQIKQLQETLTNFVTQMKSGTSDLEKGLAAAIRPASSHSSHFSQVGR